jgi:hypothetical protein
MFPNGGGSPKGRLSEGRLEVADAKHQMVDSALHRLVPIRFRWPSP